MKYIPLSSLQNPYPTISNYRNEDNSVSIDGFYEENSLNIPVSDFRQLVVIPGTSFRFIVKTDEGGLYTSDSFYNDLVRAKESKNPYFINTALNPKTFVQISISQLKQTFDERIIKEREWQVNCVFNNIFEGNGSLNIQRFGEYIDWVVSKPEIGDIIDNGILPSSEISRFEIDEFIITDTGESDDEEPNGGNTSEGGNSGGNTPGGGNSGGNSSPLPEEMAGGSTPSGEGEQGNLPSGGNQGNRDPFVNPGGNPEEDIANEYTTRYRNTNREL